ncbi:MAG: ParA family protein [Hyphomicrobiaceae bacterium]
MRAHVAAIASMKGGVGKTTLTLSLAEGTAALKSKRVLVIDLDPQINASTLLTGAVPKDSVPWRTGTSLQHFLEKRLSHPNTVADAYVLKDAMDFSPASTVSLMSGDYELRSFERRLLVKPKQTVDAALNFARDTMQGLLDEQRSLFDLILFDCPPGFSIFTEAALGLSDTVILPTAPNNLGTQGLSAFVKYMEDELEIGDACERAHVFLTMTGRTKTSLEFEKAVRGEQNKLEPRYQVLKCGYPYMDGFQKAMDRREWNMRKLGAIQRRLNQLRNRTLFDRLYDGVDEHVEKLVTEAWTVFKPEGGRDGRIPASQGPRGHHPHEARP